MLQPAPKCPRLMKKIGTCVPDSCFIKDIDSVGFITVFWWLIDDGWSCFMVVSGGSELLLMANDGKWRLVHQSTAGTCHGNSPSVKVDDGWWWLVNDCFRWVVDKCSSWAVWSGFWSVAIHDQQKVTWPTNSHTYAWICSYSWCFPYFLVGGFPCFFSVVSEWCP